MIYSPAHDPTCIFCLVFKLASMSSTSLIASPQQQHEYRQLQQQPSARFFFMCSSGTQGMQHSQPSRNRWRGSFSTSCLYFLSPFKAISAMHGHIVKQQTSSQSSLSCILFFCDGCHLYISMLFIHCCLKQIDQSVDCLRPLLT